MLTFEARKAVRTLGLKSKTEYRKFHERDPRLVADPESHYALWKGWGHFLGTDHPGRLTYSQARALVREHGVRTWEDYRQLIERFPGLYWNPERLYLEWKSWPEFVGMPKGWWRTKKSMVPPATDPA